MKNLIVLLVSLAIGAKLLAVPVKGGPSPNILFIAIDDLNDWLGCYGGHPQVQTPHIDGLAQRGVLFTEAHCPAPVCGPSRAAIMSGLAPVHNGVYSNNATYSKRLPGVETLPEYLRRHGYQTLGAGKLFHGSHPKGAFDVYAPGTKRPYPGEALSSAKQTPVYEFRYGDKFINFPRNGMPADRVWRDQHSFDWGPLDVPDHEFRDAQNIAWAVDRLNETYEKPLFLGVGFHLPHQPLYAPKRFHDLYPPETVVLPPNTEGDLDDLSQAGQEYALIPATSGKHCSVVKYQQWENAVSSYLATVSFVDHL
ncbi:MAG: sulfatase-like hydrolase/transferase, partial [Planctomycetota bacterium]